MAETNPVLADTSAIYALLSEYDLFHDTALGVWQQCLDERRELWITSYTVVETVALLNRRLGFGVVSSFSEHYLTNLQVVWVDERMHDAAWARFIESEGRGLSLVDWTIAIASRELGAHVFTFDTDFAQQGIAVIPR